MSETGRADDGTVYESTGEADGRPPLILVHGVGLDRRLWDPLVPALARHIRVITYDLRGHGESGPLPEDPHLMHFAEQFAWLRAALKIDKAVVAGFSLGGLVALMVAIRLRGWVSRLAVLNAVYERSPAERAAILQRVGEIEAAGPAAALEAALERWFTPGWLTGHPEREAWLRHRMLANDPMQYARAYRLFAMGDTEIGNAAAAIRCPTLVLTAEEDRNSTQAMARTLAARIEGARLVLVPGRHMALWEDPAAYVAPLLALLGEASP